MSSATSSGLPAVRSESPERLHDALTGPLFVRAAVRRQSLDQSPRRAGVNPSGRDRHHTDTLGADLLRERLAIRRQRCLRRGIRRRRFVEWKPPLDRRDVHDHTSATVYHGRHQRSIETDGREQVEIQLLEPAVVAERRKAAARHARSAEGVDDVVNATDSISDGVHECFDSRRACEIGLPVGLHRQACRPRAACCSHDSRTSVSQPLDHRPPGALRAASNDNAAAPELECVE